jgi:hypothetical protein
MPGATLQLVSYGAQDMYLTGNPQITYFKVVYRRHTNFSMEDIIIATMVKPTFGGQVIQKINKVGDLVHKISLIYKAQKVYAGHGLANPTTALIDYVSLVIGGHEIDRQYGHWMETYYELTKPNPNGTITNITKIDDTSLSHIASNLYIGSSHKDIQSKIALHNIYNTTAHKLTNVGGLNLSFPPTKFQKSSRCGGCYCENTALGETESGYDETGTSLNSTTLYDASYGSDITTLTAAQSDFSVAPTSIVAKSTGGDGAGSATIELTDSTRQTLVSVEQLKKYTTVGSFGIGICTLEIPFYCSKDPGLSLPLIAMQNQEVQLDIHLSGLSAAKWTNTPYSSSTPDDNYISNCGTISNMQNCYNAYTLGTGTNDNGLRPIRNSFDKIDFNIDISVLYIYLDTDERRRFAEVSHEYLIEQVQYLAHSGGDTNIDISTFSHPVKEVIWTGQPYRSDKIKYATSTDTTHSTNQELNNGTKAHPTGVRFQPGNENNIVGGGIVNSTATLGFGNANVDHGFTSHTVGGSTFTSQGHYVVGLLGPSTPSCLDDCDWSLSLNDIERTTPQPLQQYTRNNVERYHTGYGSVSCPDSIAVYSFALKPEDHQPSGSCNFSKIDKVMLHRYKGQDASANPVKLNIYAVNYNILRVMSGMAALAYTL